jgi:hypothetical protein
MLLRAGIAGTLAFLLVGLTPVPQPPATAFDPLRGSLARREPLAVYSPDPADPWNQAFFLLFTQTIQSRVIADGALPFASGDERLRLTDRRVTRIEGGDRAIDPLYPSWLWMGSMYFDFEPGDAFRILQEPRYSQFLAALQGIRRTAASRPALARALMQADLWSAFDILHALTRIRRARDAAGGGAPPPGQQQQEQDRAEILLSPLATTMRALALSREEIARLPDTYSAAANRLALPDLLGNRNGWMEIRWFPRRSHDDAAGYRRAARVFARPAARPDDDAALLNRLREQQGDDRGALDSVALLTQLLLVATDGTVIPSSIAFDVQFRGTAAGAVPEYELSRRRLLSSPSTGGLVPFEAEMPAYMPSAGNDLSFATPPRLDAEPVIAPLAIRCSACHGTAAGVGHLVTFSMTVAPGRAVPPVVRLSSDRNVHPQDVAGHKMEMDDFKSLRERWR